MPLHRDAGLSGRRITTLLQATRFTGTQLLAGLKRLGTHLRHAWPDTLVIVRGESHCASPEVRQWLDKPPARHEVPGLTRKAVWKALARAVVEQAQRADASSGRKGTRCHSTRYQAQTWARARRVGSKGEVSAHGVHTRLVVTAMEQARTQGLSPHRDGARGQAEHAIKAHKLYVQSDRPACHRFEANQLRLLLPAAAYGWLETWRREVFRTTQGASATMETLQ